MKNKITVTAKKITFILCTLLSLQSFAQNIDYSLIPYRSGNKWGFANENKIILITPKYDEVKWFTEGVAAVKVGTKWGYINKMGKMVIPVKYTVANYFRKGYITNKNKNDTILFAGVSTQKNEYEICINIKAIVLAKCPAIAENAMASNRVPLETVVKIKNYTTTTNSKLFDKLIDDYKIIGNDETFYIAQKADMVGVLNSKFETIVPFEYNSINAIKSNYKTYLHVTKSEMNGVLNADGSTAINTEYYSMKFIKNTDDFYDVILKKNGNTYVKELNNKDIISNGFTDIVYAENGGFILTDENNLKGFYLPNLLMIAPKYRDIKVTNIWNPYLQVLTISDKKGYINSSGVEFFED